MLTDFASVVDRELWNTARLQAYLTNVGSPFDGGPDICRCDSLTRLVIEGDPDPYTTPAADPAPWYDVDYDHSGEFLGFLPLTVQGIDDNPRARTVTNAVGGGGIFGPSQDLPRTITVTGVLLGTSCCGVDYGLHYLSEVLSGCVGANCDGDCLSMYSCCPDPGMTKAQFDAKYRRTYRRTALVSGPTVTGRQATGGGSCSSGGCSGADIVEVEFVIVAGIPWAWTDELPALSVPFPESGEGDCVEWCLSETGGSCEGETCLHQSCDLSFNYCADPLLPVVAPPQPTAPASNFCVSLAPERACYTIDLTDRPRWSNDVPIITVYTNGVLRNARITFYERPAGAISCDGYVDNVLCQPVNDFIIPYLAPHSTLTIDGQTGRSTVDCLLRNCPPAPVFGDVNGGPVNITPMSCSQYCVCLEADNAFEGPSETLVTISFSGRGL